MRTDDYQLIRVQDGVPEVVLDLPGGYLYYLDEDENAVVIEYGDLSNVDYYHIPMLNTNEYSIISAN